MNTCNKCKKKFKGRSRYQEYCDDCYRNKREVKKMVANEQEEDTKVENQTEEVEKENTEVKKSKKIKWTDKKQELCKKVIEFAKEICEDEKDIRIRSVLSGAYFMFNKSLKK